MTLKEISVGGIILSFATTIFLVWLGAMVLGCGHGPDLERENDPCTTGEDEGSTGCCEIDYLNPSLGQCLCDGVVSDPEHCAECELLPCVEPER